MKTHKPNPNSLIPIARTGLNWPVLKAKVKVLEHDHAVLLIKLQVGERTLLGSLDPDFRFNIKNKFNQVILDLIHRIESVRSPSFHFNFGRPDMGKRRTASSSVVQADYLKLARSGEANPQRRLPRPRTEAVIFEHDNSTLPPKVPEGQIHKRRC